MTMLTVLNAAIFGAGTAPYGVAVLPTVLAVFLMMEHSDSTTFSLLPFALSLFFSVSPLQWHDVIRLGAPCSVAALFINADVQRLTTLVGCVYAP